MKFILKRIFSPFLKKASSLYLRKPRNFSYNGISVMVMPSVFPPFMTHSTKILVDFITPIELSGKTFLELGCGCGIVSISAAKKGAIVTATDINETALAALEKNGRINDVKLDILYSDLFQNLHERYYDFIIINPPYYPRNPKSIAENAWFCGEDFNYFENLFLQLPQFTTLDNQIYMILSEDCALEKIEAIALKNGMVFNSILEKKVVGEKNYIFKIARL
ncbi:methyltransferase [Flavobacterium sp.]|uniref:methyltransferase n=1 Tax=Flavobacterium sp. TaxID=239 RepID=UPI002601D1B2|nr:methyltransferase [Flavobacterium sp.]